MLWEIFPIGILSGILSISGFTILAVLVRTYLAGDPQTVLLSIIRRISLNKKTVHADREIKVLLAEIQISSIPLTWRTNTMNHIIDLTSITSDIHCSNAE